MANEPSDDAAVDKAVKDIEYLNGLEYGLPPEATDHTDYIHDLRKILAALRGGEE